MKMQIFDGTFTKTVLDVTIREVAKGTLSLIAKGKVADSIPPERRDEIQDYLRLFGYKPDKTILQVHIAGYFGRKRQPPADLRAREAARRYGGTTFVVVGRCHDPSIMDVLIKPKKKQDQASPGYVGYLWKNKDKAGLAPHELVPLDFTPAHFTYPKEWKDLFATRGFMIAMHVPSMFAPYKNKLNRALYRAGKKADVRSRWDFIEELRPFGYETLVASAGTKKPTPERYRTHITSRSLA